MPKELTNKSGPNFLSGGKQHMLGPSGAGPAKAGVSGNYTGGVGSAFASGGSGNHMLPKSGAEEATAGRTGNWTSGKGADFAKGGKTKMFGYMGSIPMPAGRSGR